MSRTDSHFNLRLPKELKVKLTAAARENDRSTTTEAIARLGETFARQDIVEAKAARDALVVELSNALQAGLSAAEDLGEVRNALQEAQRVSDAKLASLRPTKENEPKQ
ncbi:hypothetical protein AvCA_51750 [Azotobacter vinelandii CA]|uniref:Arc-like DNA binding domain-containing protein n=2 Tax=Azotobacter vinelandii TaxID=354 RepID=C1DMH4_AZOVD|nr:Arc family DNA-binding protein [Azotobacter vinelandii]ACO81251.1 hypothetical protein Avin_51750 [Azotobacter vinelandii DJ]AGK15758.1 hypothetical protein AvCA_51750 [Azotobacter vinelandii CA]AGK22429.1 hypothetical protein AvCA6_51750 [Azotobacter vinelandii CA6]WKN21989.1 Arc family DNA-binding protein [Azotobacter vinelandii]SFX28081.1 Arc-like DNA binding domain-containing protein [Azotobacter vinelandii]